jgi:hypothetical protein
VTPAGQRQVTATIGQRLMWLLERRGESGALSIFHALRLRGPVQDAALLAALRDLPARHEGLRTTFSGRGPALTQIVHPPEPMPDGVAALAEVSAADLPQAVRAEAQRGFDLTAEWPCRLRVFRVGPEDRMLSLAVHHIVTDGWSQAILLDDLRALYACHAGQEAEPPDPPAWQQADFALWQQQSAQDGTLDRKVAYWREKLGARQPVRLPGVLRRPAADPGREPGILVHEVPEQAGRLLTDGALRYRSTFFAVFLAALAGYLAASTGEREIVIPAFFANRARRQAQRTVGYLANLVLLPVDLTGQPSFPDLARQVRGVLSGAIAHQDVPYHIVPPPEGSTERRNHPELVVQYLSVPGRRAPLFAEAEVSAYRPDFQMATRFPVELHISRDDGRLLVTCSYSAGHTSASAVTEFLGGFADFVLRVAGGAPAGA